MSTVWTFDYIRNKHSWHDGEDWSKKFYSSLREHAKNIINFEWYSWQKIGKTTPRYDSMFIRGKNFPKTFAKDKSHRNVGHHCILTGQYRVAAHSICN